MVQYHDLEILDVYQYCMHYVVIALVVYLINGFRWSFFGVADVGIWISLGMILAFLLLCLATIGWIFKTGYRLRQ